MEYAIEVLYKERERLDILKSKSISTRLFSIVIECERKVSELNEAINKLESEIEE